MNRHGALALAIIGLLVLAGLFQWRQGRLQAQVVTGGAGAPAEAARPASRYLTPRTADADGLEELFARVAKTGGIAHLPAGNYRISRTIRLAGLGPFRIEGEGVGDVFDPGGTGYRSQPTRLIWTGEPGGTMLNIDGSNGQSFSHLQFDGAGKAGVLVQLRSNPGFPAGGQRFTRVLFREAEIGIQCGEKATDFNCADLVYDDVGFVRCNVGLKVVNDQSVNHHFRSLGAQIVGTVFDFERGGNLFVDGWSATTFDLFLRVGSGGPNAGTFRIVAGRPEMNGRTRRHARLVEAASVNFCDIVLEGNQETGGPLDDKLPDNPDEPVFTIGPRAVLTVRNHCHQRPAIAASGGIYRDEASRWMVPPPPKEAAARSVGRIEIRDATDGNGAAIDGGGR